MDNSKVNLNLIFLDANFILVPSQLSVDIYREFDRILPTPRILIIIRPVLDELERKKNQRRYKGSFSRHLSLGLQLLNKRSYAILNVQRPPNVLVDDLLIEIISHLQEGTFYKYIEESGADIEKLVESHIPEDIIGEAPARSSGKASKESDLIGFLRRYLEEQTKDPGNIKVYLATNDRDLRRKARERNIRVIFVRQSSYLEIE